ncbi:MAG: hypothetical protein OXH99_08070 [Bryobacterales bacterium]|nr:hypothetical protein [Bryobacterales bacterium]
MFTVYSVFTVYSGHHRGQIPECQASLLRATADFLLAYRRDKTFGEENSRMRTGQGLSNTAALDSLALALLLSRWQFETVPEPQSFFMGNRDEAIQLVLRSGQPALNQPATRDAWSRRLAQCIPFDFGKGNHP